ncbi:MAG TPA: secretin N-terminal domain-containing protein [Thermoanaerobaculia bacterium]|jgi:general secretion pathway protein D
MKHLAAALLIALPLFSCVSYKAYELGQNAEVTKDWDTAVTNYEKALQVDPQNMKYTIALSRAKLEASRLHFQKGKTLKGAADSAAGAERIRLATLAATEFELTVKLDTTNQYAAVELGKSVRMVQDTQAAMSGDKLSIDEMKKRAQITKVQPPQLNPASNEPISLNFSHETPVKDIYRALGNAFGINILFDQAVKDDRISIELKDVTAQQALERVMQAANHFYKVLDEHTIIVVPDNPQARRDYEDLVIQTFYLSNGDAEQVTNVVRTMIEARNVFPLKALNAITIRDTADKVRIAQKIIEANDKAKAEVVVDVELLQMDLTKTRDIGFALAGVGGSPIVTQVARTDDKGNPTSATITGGTNVAATLDDLRNLTSKSFSFSVPQPTYGLLKSVGNAELLANPELRISEGEKASLHIGQRIPVPVSTFTSAAVGSTTGGTFAPVTSYQYQDVGIKVAIEPRVHHNNEVTLKLTVEVSNLGTPVSSPGQPDQPTFATRTIESTIRLKDGETNFLAGLIQDSTQYNDKKTPFLGDIPILGRFFTESSSSKIRTDLVLTMTPHIVRMPDITEDDVAPMWVGTQNNLTFRGVSPRIESQTSGDPFVQQRPPMQVAPEGEGDVTPNGRTVAPAAPAGGNAPTNPFLQNQNNPPNTAAPPSPNPNPPQASLSPSTSPATQSMASTESLVATPSIASLRLAPRMGAEPVTLKILPGEQKVWNIIGMDLEGLSTDSLVLHYDRNAMDVSEVIFGNALLVDPKTPPVATINRDTGTVKITSSDGKPLQFVSGGDVIGLRVRGSKSGETMLVVEPPELHDGAGTTVMTAVTGGRAQVQ